MAKERKEKIYGKEQILWAAIIALLFVLSLLLDKQLLIAISSLRNSFFDIILAFLQKWAVIAAGIAAVSALIFFKEKQKVLKLWLAIASTAITSLILKYIIQRTRPFIEIGINVAKEIKPASWDWSFPSFHTAIMFCIIPFLKGKIKTIWIIFSILVAFARIYFALHWPSDIIGGIGLGLLAAYIINKK